MQKALSKMFRKQARHQPSVEEDVDSIRRRILLAFILFTPLILAVDAGPFFLNFAALSVAALAAAVLIGFRRAYHRVGFFYLSALQLYLGLHVLSSESIHSAYYFMLPGSIIVAALTIGIHLAIWFSILCASTLVVGIEWNSMHGLKFPGSQTLADYTWSTGFILLAMESFLLVIALIYDNFRQQRQLAVTSERSRISRSLYNFALGELVGSVSHEVNNPLAIVSAISLRMERVIAHEPYAPELEPLLKQLDRAVQRIRYIVDGLTLFAKGKPNEALEKKSVWTLCQFIREFHHESLQHSGVHFQVNDLTDNMVFSCRFQQLTRSLNGLIKNAREATAGVSQGQIALNIFLKKNFLTLEVRDNGRGVPEELREHLFEPFFSTKDLQAGQGLTLAISRGLIEAQGGQLIYTPLPDGSSFSILLPVSPQGRKGKKAYAAHRQAGQGLSQRSLTILNKIPG